MYSSGIAQRGMVLLSKICYKIETGPKENQDSAEENLFSGG